MAFGVWRLTVDVCSKFLNDKKSKHFNNVSTQHLNQSTKALGGGLKSDQWEGGLGKVMVWGVDQGMVDIFQARATKHARRCTCNNERVTKQTFCT